jgi:hypothetical protein
MEPVMTVNSRLEGLYSQVELVRGVGDRRTAQLCIMSFVALLAGEDHSDSPVTTSPVIRRFAITINDQMPEPLRQDLKCFAPEMIGTRDGHDRARTKLLFDAARIELLPRIEADIGGCGSASLAYDKKRTFRSWLHAYHWVKTYVTASTNVLDEGRQEDAAWMVACLICGCAHIAALAHQRAWYWAKAVDLLDRLCTIGTEDARPTVSEDHLDLLSGILANRHQPLPGHTRAASLWMRVRSLLPA